MAPTTDVESKPVDAPAPLVPSTALQPTNKAPVQMGVAPKTLDEGWRLAQMLAKSELVPKNFRNKPEDILVAVQMGLELGLPPLAALSSIAVINGRASLWGDGFIAVLMSSPLYEDHDEFYEVDGERRDGLTVEDLKKDTTAAVCTFWRHGKKTPVTRRFTIAQAKSAGLWGKDGPWKQYGDRMLSMRARGFAGRDAFPDLLRGMRTAEEVRDTPPETDHDGAADGSVVVREVRRISETKADPAPAAAPSMPTAEAERVVVAGVKTVEQFLTGFRVVLSDGKEVITENVTDALELEKFAGTDHKLRIVYTVRNGEFLVASFGIAD